MAGLDPPHPAPHPAILRRLIEDSVWLEDWRPDPEIPSGPIYRLCCPHCGTENPGFQVVAATFQTGPFITAGGVIFTPDDTPDTVTVQCRVCQTLVNLSDLREPEPTATSH